jgi:biopolymer transport protein ExbD
VAFSSLDNGNGGRGRGRLRGGSALSEINVTPFVDVLLVLLIIFMLTAHVMESGIEIDVPAVKSTKDTTKDLPIVDITKTGDLYLGGTGINIHEIAGSVRKRYAGSPTVYVRADKQTPFDIVAQVLAELGAAKIGVSVVTKPEDSTRRRR